MSETKVVFNACFGGFGLSVEAKREYLRRTGQTWTEVPSHYASMPPVFYVGGEYWSDDDIDRADPALVAVVEAMGRRASDACAELAIKVLPKGTLYRIDEYDGRERVETRDGIDWSVA